MPTNYSNCVNCPYNPNSSNYALTTPSLNGVPCNIDQGSNAQILLVFQAPGIDEWVGNTISGNQLPIDSVNPHSAAARMRNSFTRRTLAGNPTNRAMYDITESVQCFPDKYKSGRDKKPLSAARNCCNIHLQNDLSAKQYQSIICFGQVAFNLTQQAIRNIGSWKGPTPILAQHPSSRVSNTLLDLSY
ncbi:MAG: hypothetical protein WC319_10560 [Candidatus Paceibacterota bacterium]|jgi:uracil-DNA glycosylase